MVKNHKQVGSDTTRSGPLCNSNTTNFAQRMASSDTMNGIKDFQVIN